MLGRVAQLVEHYLDMVVVAGSSPVVATIPTVLQPETNSACTKALFSLLFCVAKARILCHSRIFSRRFCF